MRAIEKLLENDKIIPLDIYHICFDFIFSTTIVFYLHGLRDRQSADPERDLVLQQTWTPKKDGKLIFIN